MNEETVVRPPGAPQAPLPTSPAGPASADAAAGEARPTARQRESAEDRVARYAQDDHHSLRERTAGARWRRRLAARRSVDHAYRVGVGVVGGLILVVGIIAIPLPGPGWLIVIAGLFVLATEFTWAERLLEYTTKHVTRWTEWVNAQPVWVRVLLAAATAAFVYGVLMVTLHITGVPGWMPGWVPLWR